MNNQITIIRVEINDSSVINVNAFIGNATRKIGNFIDKTIK